MSIDLSGAVKSAVVNYLSTYADLTAVVPSSRIYGMSVPANIMFPFIRYGHVDTQPFEASCWRGATVRFAINAFAESKSGGEAGEDACGIIAAIVIQAINSMNTIDDNTSIVDINWLSTKYKRDDDESDRWHVIIEYEIIAVINHGS